MLESQSAVIFFILTYSYFLNVSTTPITAMGCWQCLPLSVVQLKGKHCRKPHCRNDVVDTLQLCYHYLTDLSYMLFLFRIVQIQIHFSRNGWKIYRHSELLKFFTDAGVFIQVIDIFELENSWFI